MMEPYRIVYRAVGGAAQREQWIACDSANEAIDWADIAHPHEIEVWRRGRLVARVPSVSEMYGAPARHRTH